MSATEERDRIREALDLSSAELAARLRSWSDGELADLARAVFRQRLAELEPRRRADHVGAVVDSLIARRGRR